jgi:hypothetical protein
MDKERFAGAWKLVSNEYLSEDGVNTYPLGKEAIGLIMYDGKRSMSAQLMNAKRPQFVANDWLKGTPEEIKSAYQGIRCYFGTYDVDEEKKIVTHHVQGHSFPNGIGTDNVRYYELSGNNLILRTVPIMMNGRKVIGRLVWEKL